ncbi:hypothetical protein RJ639_025235 [Escallonia herrerae]|uniref:Uncharacterized protein n=1 Tax=Escallonia herrerae TaxID=1293975 RepID=A0AA88RV67_9ASTE|nr:hypothetical protein RJ639_025235 [Escallonia herrerae]
MASRGRCTRDLKDDGVFKSVFQNQLPRGPVPPSMPSPCHNKLYGQSDASYPQDRWQHKVVVVTIYKGSGGNLCDGGSAVRLVVVITLTKVGWRQQMQY